MPEPRFELGCPRGRPIASPADTRLTQEHQQSEQRAEALVAAWEVEGDSRGLERMTAAFWDDGTAWIEKQLGGKS